MHEKDMGYPDFCIQMDTKTRIDLKTLYKEGKSKYLLGHL